MQNGMRAEKRKSLKRGKKKGKGKGRKNAAKAKGGTKARRSKRSILKAASPRKADKTQAKTTAKATAKAKAKAKARTKTEEAKPEDPEVKAVPTKSRTKRKAASKDKTKNEAPTTSAKKAKQSTHADQEAVNQDRIGSGRFWTYVVLKDQTLGCRSCRFIYNGCLHCRKPNFKGKRAQDAYVEQQASIKKAKCPETQQASAPSEEMEEQASGSHQTPVHKKRRAGKKAANVD